VFKDHKIFIILILIFLIFIASAFSVWYFLIKENTSKEEVKTEEPKILSEEDKLRILESLAQRDKQNIPVEEKQKVLESLAKRDKQNISEEEKLKILESLQNRN
jgi:hypothetical protein